MSLTSNPFYVLGAAPSDDRRRIMALANDRRLDGDEAAIREARVVLTNPRKRLAAEIAWLPGLEEDEIRQALAAKNEHPSALLPTLARANLMADGLVEADSWTSSGLAAWRIVELAAAHDRIRADKVTTVVNESRLAAGVPMASQQDVVEQLRDRGNHFRDAMERCLDGLAFERMVEVVTVVVHRATLGGTRLAPPLIDSLIDSYYERKVHEKMAARRQEIGKLVSQVRGRVGVDVAGIVAQIEREVKAWDVMAQPTQVSLASRGMSHTPSDEIMREVRNFAIELFNKHGLLKVAQNLTKTLRKVFAEMEPITELLDKDVSALDGIAKRVGAAVGRGSGAHTSGSLAHAGGTRAVRKPVGSHHERKVHEKRRWRVAAFFVGCAFTIWILVAIAGESNRSTRSGSSGTSRSVPDALRPAPPARSKTPSTNLDYSTSPVGTDDVHSVPEIRWCLRQDIRIETWRSLAMTDRQIAAFNQVVEDYNGRCGSYSYYQESMTTAQREVSSRRSEIITEARRFPPWRLSGRTPNSNSTYLMPTRPPVTIVEDALDTFGRVATGRWIATGRGSDTIPLLLPAGTYAASTTVVGARGLARIQAKQLDHGPFWLSGFGSSIRGHEKFSLVSPEVLEVDVNVSQNAEWTIRIEKVPNREEY